MLAWLVWSTVAAPGIDEARWLINKAQGLCLDVIGNEAKPGDRLTLWACVPGPNDADQRWLLNSRGELRNESQGNCLGAEGTDGARGRNLVIESCSGEDDQRWEAGGKDGFELRNRAQGLCLDAAGKAGKQGDNLLLWACDGGADQRWSWQRAGATSASPDRAIVGAWAWLDDVTVRVLDDGTVEGSNGHYGTWKTRGPTRYELRWAQGWIDTLQLSSDGSELIGSNQHGRQIRATRAGVKRPAPIVSPPAPPPQQAAPRDCGTGPDDGGCQVPVKTQLPMDGDAFLALKANLEATPSELSKRDIIIVYTVKGGRVLTARQLFVLLDMFNSELTKLQIARAVAAIVSDRDHALSYGSKLRSSLNRADYLKIFSAKKP